MKSPSRSHWLLNMRMLNLWDWKISEFFEKEIPPYYILSHRWGDEEINYEDFVKKHNPHESPAFHKIMGACSFAKSFRLPGRPKVNWLWIDTCCIDKRSSSELSEAINSMYQWYRKAELCIAYLSDVPRHDSTEKTLGQAFVNSSWFTRGWTLQELLAPETIIFCNEAWKVIGDITEDLPRSISIDRRPLGPPPGEKNIRDHCYSR